MDVRKPTRMVACAFILILSACSPGKSVNQVFDDNNKPMGLCGSAVKDEFLVQWENGHVEKIKWSDSESFKKEFVEPNLEKIKYVEYNRIIKLDDTSIEPLGAVAFSEDWGQRMIQADLAWAQGVSGESVKVGVVDTWVDYSHPQLSNQFEYNTADIPNNGIDDDGNGYIDDYYGFSFFQNDPTKFGQPSHGSHVAGIVAAEHSSGPVKGVAHGAKIIQAPFLNNAGSGSLEDAISALEYVRIRGVKIVNASWGAAGCSGSRILAEQIQKLANDNILIVVAAGNSGNDIGISPESPAILSAPNQITVAWSNSSDILQRDSNYSFSLVHLAAPGEQIFSTVPLSTNPSGSSFMRGTSMATPFVSAAAALLWSVKPNAHYSQIKQAILSSVEGAHFPVSTRGRLNVKKALDEIRRLVP